MSLYGLARPLLFSLDPETAHRLTLRLAHFAPAPKVPARPVKAMGLEFPNPVGMAAGMDKHAEHVDALAALGFGFLELGGVLPRPQPGNPPPRLFRLPGAEAVINRLGLNTIGVDAFAANLQRATAGCIIGANISKNKDTPNERAVEDYLRCLEVLFPLVNYLSINVSSPNTKGLRDMQSEQLLTSLLRAMRERRDALRERHGRHVALAPKISPDVDEPGLRLLADIAVQSGMDGIIANNTTISRDGLDGVPYAQEAGGISGAPLRARSTEVVRQLARHLQGALPIVGVGGIMSRADALERFEAGATLIQVYTGLVYRGPGLHRRMRAVALVDEARCIGCTRCIDACPVDAIVGAQGLMHTVVESWCIGCDLCLPACPVDCIAMVAPRGGWSTADRRAAGARARARKGRLSRKIFPEKDRKAILREILKRR